MVDKSVTIQINGRNRTGPAVRQAEKDFARLSGRISALRRDVLALAGVTVSIGGVAQLASLADNYALIGARLRVAIGETGNFVEVQRALVDLAKQTNSDLTATVDLYARVARSTRELAISQQDTLDLTRLVNQSLRLSGAGAAQASALVTQFGQALASGVLRGDEFNSVMENGSRLALALGDGLGVGVGQLRAMAEAGELTASKVINALLSQRDVIGNEVASLPLTLAAAFTNLETALTDYIGRANEASGVTGSIAGGIQSVADSFDAIADAAITAGAALLAVYGGRQIGALQAYVATQIAAARSTRALAVATIDDLRAKEAAALAARSAAVANLGMARAMDQATGGMARQAVAAREVAAAHTAYAAAAARTAAATQNASIGLAAGRGALALLGGPLGAITTGLLLGVTAWTAYGDSAEQSVTQVSNFADEADRLLGNLDAITQRQLQSAITLGESTVAAIEQRIKVVSAALQSERNEARAVELRRELIDLQQREIDEGDRLVALRQKLANLATEQANRNTGGTAGAVADENDKLSELIKARDKLLKELQAINDGLAAGPDVAEQSTSFNVAELNTLRNQAAGKLETGDTAGALADLQRAKAIIEALAQTGELSTGYLQTQIKLIGDLSREVTDSNVTPEVDEAAATQSFNDYAALRDQFLQQNPGATLVTVDEDASLQALRAALERLQAEAAQNAITVPVAAAPTGVGNEAPAFAAGGAVRGPGSGTSDSILSWLSNGEYVLKAAAVQRYGLGFINRLNRMELPRYRDGGPVVPTVQPTAVSPTAPQGAPLTLVIDGQSTTVQVTGDNVTDLRRLLKREQMKRGTRS